MNKDSKIFVAGHTGMVGKAICRALNYGGYSKVITAPHSDLELRNEAEVRKFIAKHQPEYVFMCAAIVGGIEANMSKPVDFLLGNLQIQNNVIAASLGFVKKLLFLGSSCIYPRNCEQPMKESSLFTGPLEPTNQWYALAKLTGMKLCEAFRHQYSCNFINVIPCNLYGYGDNYDDKRAHVIPALIRKLHEAKETKFKPHVVIWGRPDTRREFLYVDDLADACVLLMQKYDSPDPINVGYGSDISIFALVQQMLTTMHMQDHVTFTFDPKKAIGMPRKLLDCSRIQNMGWTPKVHLEQGIQQAYLDYLIHYGSTAKNMGKKGAPAADSRSRRKVQALRRNRN